MQEIYSTNPKLKYIQLDIYGHKKESKELIFSIVPESLYRFQPPKNDRFKTLENKELFLSPVVRYDDPFDSIGIFCNYQELSNSINFSEDSTKVLIQYLYKFRQDFLSVCFSENRNNLPLWAFNAQNYEGFAIEYNFHELGMANKINDILGPVIYEPSRIDTTNALKSFFSQINQISKGDMSSVNRNTLILYYSNFVKHENWKFQDEWRILNHNQIIPDVKPKAIYIGYKSSDYTRKRLQNISRKIGCGCFQMRKTEFDEEKFDLHFEEFS